MDNCISAESRLSYSVECLLFELQRRNVSKKKSIELIQKLD